MPKIAWECYSKGKYRESFLKRLGIAFPLVIKGNRPLIWIHAVSVGEAKATVNLVRQLKLRPENPLIIITSITETGHAEAKRSVPEADYHLYMPFDFYYLIAPILKRIKPDRIILCETDFWYNFLRIGKKLGAQLSIVNGKISQRSFERFKRFPFFSKPLFSLVDHFCLQNVQYAERFKMLGVSSDKIVVTGNLKFETMPKSMTPEDRANFRADLGISHEDKVIVIGSSHESEEKDLLEAMRGLWVLEPKLKVIVVPRHPERFDSVEEVIKGFSLPYCRYSKRNSDSNKASVLLLDAMGLLGKCYQIATIAIVAGSFTRLVGGHNILEPLWFGIPMVYGPHMFGQLDLVEAVSGYEAGLQMSLEEIGKGLERLLKDPEEADRLRAGSDRLIAAMQGATARTYDALVR